MSTSHRFVPGDSTALWIPLGVCMYAVTLLELREPTQQCSRRILHFGGKLLHAARLRTSRTSESFAFGERRKGPA